MTKTLTRRTKLTKKAILILTCWLLGFTSGMSQQRKIADVQHIADSILSQPSRWGGKPKAKTVKTRRIIAASDLTESQQNAFYICDAGADGFAVISADERMISVLGFSQDRVFDIENIPTGMQELLNSYTKEYEALTSESTRRILKRKIEGVKEQVGPLLTTEWGQDKPFNNKCPEWEGERCITGCVAVTTAQAMRYYQYPDSAKGNVNYITKKLNIPITEDLSAYKFNWPIIRNSYNTGTTEDEDYAVSNLLYACAAAVEMDFGLSASSASSTNQVRALVEKFGYDPDIACIHKDYMTTSEWQTLMLNELNAESPRPIIYAAVSPTEGGHSFIIDGYKADEDAYPYYHVNWGWRGYCNGYFKLSSLDADGLEFSKEHEAIIFIQPNNEKQDNGYFLQAQEVVLSSARINPDKTHQFSVTLKLFNYSYKPFSGKIEIYLLDKNQEETLVGTSQRINKLPLSSGFSNFMIQATLPQNIAEGDYTLIIRSKNDNNGEMETVTYSSPQTLTVTTITESYTPNIMINDLTNMGEDWNGLSMSVRATLPRNGAAKSFVGWLQMAVADDKGNLLDHFGKVAYISNLGMGYYLPYAYTFEGQLPNYLEDGKYRLYLAANQSGYLEWGKVTGYKIEGNQIVENEIYIPFWLEDGKIIYHKGGEEDLPEFYADIQVTDMEVTSFNPETRLIEMQMSNVLNFGDEQFVGQFSMVVYDEANALITTFGEPQKMSTPIGHFQSTSKIFNFSGNLPQELGDGNYNVKIAAKQNGCRGWSPIKGWIKQGNYIAGYNIGIGYDFIIMNNRMYKVETDGIMAPVEQTEQGPAYNLNGQRISSSKEKGIYIINGKKVAK